MRRNEYLAAFLVAACAAGCARVGIPPGRERVDDDEPPRLKKIKTVDAHHLEVYFSEGMDATTLRDAGNFTIVSEAGEPLPVEAAVVGRPDMVTLVTAAQEAGTEYTLAARNVADATGGNRIERDHRKDFKGSKKADEKAPAVMATYPAGGGGQVGLLPEIIVEFTDVMTAGVPVAEAIAMYDDLGTEIPGDGGFERHRLRLRPSRRLDYATRYTVVVKDTCADLAGNLLYRENRFAFTTIEDREEVIISGRVRGGEEGVSPAGVEVRLSLSPRPTAEGARVAGYAVTDEGGAFVLEGVAPNSESKATYYLVAAVDEDDDGVCEFVGGYGFTGGKAAALPAFKGGERLENVEVVLGRADVEGPRVVRGAFSPNPTAGQRGAYVTADFTDAEGSAVAAAELFFDEVWSDGTGVKLNAVGAGWKTGAAARGERYLLDLREWGVKKRGGHVAYVHGKDAAGNWGEFREVPFEVTEAPKPARTIEGTVWFEKEPAAGALVMATAAGEARPGALAVTEKNGRYRFEDLAAGEYEVAARLDEDEDGRWRRGEPEGVAAHLVDVATASARGVEIELTYGPSLSSANARLHNFAGGPGTEVRARLTISAAARDRDLDLARVVATLPDGEEVELLDDGAPPDDASGDGVFTYGREYFEEELATVTAGDVAVRAEDRRGNHGEATPASSPGLAVHKLLAPPAVKLRATPEALEVSWEPVVGAGGGYVVFLVPADRLERFSAPGTGEVFSNFRNPVFGTSLTIPYAAIEDWWAYPAKSRFVVFLVASAGDAASFEASDKALISAGWRKPAPRR